MKRVDESVTIPEMKVQDVLRWLDTQSTPTLKTFNTVIVDILNGRDSMANTLAVVSLKVQDEVAYIGRGHRTLPTGMIGIITQIKKSKVLVKFHLTNAQWWIPAQYVQKTVKP